MSDERDFVRDHGSSLAAAAAARGTCPPNELLVDLAAGRLEPAAAQRAREHVAVCGVCSLLLDRLAAGPADDELLLRRLERRLDRRSAPWRRHRPAVWGALTAAAAIAAVLLLPRPVHEPQPPVLRGGGPTLAGPLGEVTAVETFRWEPSPVWDLYRFEAAVGEEVWTTTTRRPELAPPPDLAALLAGALQFRWRVVALGPGGEEVAASNWSVVRVREVPAAARDGVD